MNFYSDVQSIKICQFSKILATVDLPAIKFNFRKCNSTRSFRQTKDILRNPWFLEVLLEIVPDFGRHGDLFPRSLYVSIIP